MRRKKLEVIVSGLWPSENWDKGKGKRGAEYSVDETGVTTASRGEKMRNVMVYTGQVTAGL